MIENSIINKSLIDNLIKELEESNNIYSNIDTLIEENEDNINNYDNINMKSSNDGLIKSKILRSLLPETLFINKDDNEYDNKFNSISKNNILNLVRNSSLSKNNLEKMLDRSKNINSLGNSIIKEKASNIKFPDINNFKPIKDLHVTNDLLLNEELVLDGSKKLNFKNKFKLKSKNHLLALDKIISHNNKISINSSNKYNYNQNTSNLTSRKSSNSYVNNAVKKSSSIYNYFSSKKMLKVKYAYNFSRSNSVSTINSLEKELYLYKPRPITKEERYLINDILIIKLYYFI